MNLPRIFKNSFLEICESFMDIRVEKKTYRHNLISSSLQSLYTSQQQKTLKIDDKQSSIITVIY